MTIKEIAKLAGVSVATVSRSINQPEKVVPETRERILDIIRRTDYAPNPSAQSLSTGQTRTVACVVPTLRNEVFNLMVEGCQKLLGLSGYRLLIYVSNNDPNFWEKIDQRGVDGIILCGIPVDEDMCNFLKAVTRPYVLIGNPDQAMLPTAPVSCVYIEDYYGVQQALSYFYQNGHRHFGVIGGSDSDQLTLRRRRAVHDFFRDKPDCKWRLENTPYADFEQSGQTAMRFLQDDAHPTAFFCFNDMIATGVLRRFLGEGLSVPGDVEVVGFDDITLSRFFTPSLSTVAAPNAQLGEKAAELLVNHLKGGAVQPFLQLFSVQLCLRESTKSTNDAQ